MKNQMRLGILLMGLVFSFLSFAIDNKVLNLPIKIAGNDYSLTGSLPKITGAKNLSEIKSCNQVLQKLVDNLAGSAKKEKQAITISYKIAFITDDWVSIEFYTEADNFSLPHLAHPDSGILTFNYDLKNNKEVKLADVFKADKKYLSLLADFTNSALLKQIQENPDPEWIKTGTAPKSENFENFLLNQDGLIIVFKYYQVGPRPVGTPEVLIPIRKLRSFLAIDWTR